MTARCIMVLGTSSDAGKSWLVTALCRHYAMQGRRVAPFKAQNMTGRSCPASGIGGAPGEISIAQYLQARAARAQADVRMNPVLLRPQSDTRSQVIVEGRLRPDLGSTPWRQRSRQLWPVVTAALDALQAENELVIIEGAGSPTEINLMDSDICNLAVARHASARCLLVADIARGGAFAHLYGTWALMPKADRQRLHGFVLNKFRGDAALLQPAPEQLQVRTGVPVVAVILAHMQHGLPPEDSLSASPEDAPALDPADERLEPVFDTLAQIVEAAFAPGFLDQLAS